MKKSHEDCKKSHYKMNTQNVAYPYNGTLFSNEREQSTDPCYNIKECQKHHTNWRKTDVKDYISYDSIY